MKKRYTANFPMYRKGERVNAVYTGSGLFRQQELHETIDIVNVFGVDTESTLKKGALTTDLIPVAFFNSETVIDDEETSSEQTTVLERFLALVIAKYGVAPEEHRESRTAQRPSIGPEGRMRRKSRTGRDGRRCTLPIVVSIWFNLPYDIGRLFPDREMLKRIYSGCDSYRMRISDRFEIEWCRYIDASAPQFKWIIRDYRDNLVCLLHGIDLTGYWKCSLDAACNQLGFEGKIDIESIVKDVHERAFESFTPEERDMRKSYSIRDVDLTLRLYHETVKLLCSIDPRVVRKTGLIPPSAPGAAARIMFAKAFDQHPELKSWQRPPVWADRLGGESYYGGRAFCANPGRARRCVTLDLKSAYPHVMCLLPDPVKCEYRKVHPQKGFDVSYWRGKFGVLRVSGESLDSVYPAFRIHDSQRLRYVTGRFKNLAVTIPELVVGVVRGALRIDRILDGVELVGSPKKSFIRQYVLDMYRLKEKEGKSPLGLLAKLMLNSPYGKLIEVNASEYRWEDQIPVPDFSQLPPAHRAEVARSIVTLLANEGEAGDVAASLFWGEGTPEERSELRHQFMSRAASYVQPYSALEAYVVILETHFGPSPTTSLAHLIANARVYRTGPFFMPVFGSQITGYVSAQLGCMAACVRARLGDTDSVHVEVPEGVDHPEGLVRYYELMTAAGYEPPRKGGYLLEGTTLGTWEFESPHPSEESFLVRPKRYSHKFVNVLDKKTGELQTIYKQATHGMSKYTTLEAELAAKDTSLGKDARVKRARFLREEGVHQAMGRMLDGETVTYSTRRTPRKGRASVKGGGVVGEFVSQVVTVVDGPVEHTRMGTDGWVVWNPLDAAAE